MSAPRIAVLGAGYWGRNLVRNFSQLHALAYICDADEGTLEEQCTQYREAEPATSLDAVLSDETVEGVVLATPAALHFEHAKRALEHGKVHRVRVLRGGYEVAVEFETPLEILNAGATAT